MSCRWWSGFDLLRRLLFIIVVFFFSYVQPSYTQVIRFTVMYATHLRVSLWLAHLLTDCLTNHRSLNLHCLCMLKTIRWKMEQQNWSSSPLWLTCPHSPLPWHWNPEEGICSRTCSTTASPPVSQHSTLHHHCYSNLDLVSNRTLASYIPVVRMCIQIKGLHSISLPAGRRLLQLHLWRCVRGCRVFSRGRWHPTNSRNPYHTAWR